MMPMISTLMQAKLLRDHHGLPRRACIGLHIGLSNALHQVDLTMRVANPLHIFLTPRPRRCHSYGHCKGADESTWLHGSTLLSYMGAMSLINMLA